MQHPELTTSRRMKSYLNFADSSGGGWASPTIRKIAPVRTGEDEPQLSKERFQDTEDSGGALAVSTRDIGVTQEKGLFLLSPA